jgi:hypothetical protein
MSTTKRIGRRALRLAAGSLVALPLCVGVLPADAAPDVVVAFGSGTYSPGIPGFPPTNCVQTTITIGFSPFVVAGTDLTLLGAETFAGNGFECPASGSGSGLFNGPMTGVASYTRSADVMTFSGSVSINGASGSLILVCTINPTSALPTASFLVTCHGALN